MSISENSQLLAARSLPFAEYEKCKVTDSSGIGFEATRPKNTYANAFLAIRTELSEGRLNFTDHRISISVRVSMVRHMVHERYGFFPSADFVATALKVLRDKTCNQRPTAQDRLTIVLKELFQTGILPHAYVEFPSVALTALGHDKKGGFFDWLCGQDFELATRGRSWLARDLHRNWGAKSWRMKRLGLRGILFPPLSPLRQHMDEIFGATDWDVSVTDWHLPAREYALVPLAENAESAAQPVEVMP